MPRSRRIQWSQPPPVLDCFLASIVAYDRTRDIWTLEFHFERIDREVCCLRNVHDWRAQVDVKGSIAPQEFDDQWDAHVMEHHRSTPTPPLQMKRRFGWSTQARLGQTFEVREIDEKMAYCVLLKIWNLFLATPPDDRAHPVASLGWLGSHAMLPEGRIPPKEFKSREDWGYELDELRSDFTRSSVRDRARHRSMDISFIDRQFDYRRHDFNNANIRMNVQTYQIEVEDCVVVTTQVDTGVATREAILTINIEVAVGIWLQLRGIVGGGLSSSMRFGTFEDTNLNLLYDHPTAFGAAHVTDSYDGEKGKDITFEVSSAHQQLKSTIEADKSAESDKGSPRQ